MHTGNGAASSAVIYFEHDPGEHHGRHTDSVEEVVLVLDAEVQVTAGDERMRLSEGTLALVRRWSRTTSPTSGRASFAWSASFRAPR
jgi:quercetin dioxygenase-like cupin family protein